MWTILDAAEFYDSPLAFTYRRNDGYFSFNAISVYKVCYIDFWIKILGRLFVNDKQILNRMFQILFSPLRSGGNRSSYVSKAAGLFKYVLMR